jgi:hypothetical protein
MQGHPVLQIECLSIRFHKYTLVFTTEAVEDTEGDIFFVYREIRRRLGYGETSTDRRK